MTTPRNPFPTVDTIIEVDASHIVAIRRANPPHGWALPGGFIDYGERVEDAARREAREETGLDVELVALLGVYSAPDRDPRHHTMSVVYVARAAGEPVAADDAEATEVVAVASLFDRAWAFDHENILRDYVAWRATGAAQVPR